MFRCIVCSVHLNSADRIDRHALAHFLRGPDLESAIDARLLSARQHETPISQTSSADNAGKYPWPARKSVTRHRKQKTKRAT